MSNFSFIANITDGPSSAKKPNIRPARGYPTIADRLLVKSK